MIRISNVSLMFDIEFSVLGTSASFPYFTLSFSGNARTFKVSDPFTVLYAVGSHFKPDYK